MRNGCWASEETYYEDPTSRKVSLSKPHSQTLYAMTRARPELSMILVRRRKKPMKVRKMRAVSATPRNVEDRGDVAAVE